MRILWAVSSVGKGHIMRDIAIVNQLQTMANVEVDWLAPDPAGDFLLDRGYNVLECSKQLAGSGKVYAQVFENCVDEFNLLDYMRLDTALHQHDFAISTQAWGSKSYDVIVGDEAFWLLSGFSSKPSKKPAPFVFLTDFIGMKAMRFRMGDLLTTWYTNFKFAMSHFVPDEYIYIGSIEEIPDERLGVLLPGRRSWAQAHCQFVKPIVTFNPDAFTNQKALRQQLGLPDDKHLFLAVVGPEGNHKHRTIQIEKTFEILKQDFPDAHFILVGPQNGVRNWIQYSPFLEELYAYFAVSNCVLIQSGYGKAAELLALGVPFIAIPLNYHFEQEYVMAHRLRHYGGGKLLASRQHSPDEIALEVKEMLNKKVQRVPVGNGTEVSTIILNTA